MVRYFNPTSISAPVAAFSHGAEIQPGARYLFTAGQTGRGADGEIPASMEAQAERTFERLGAILEDAGMGPGNIVKMNQYMTDPDDKDAVLAARLKFLGEARPPDTLVFIQRLAHPDLRLEVEIVAAAE